MIEYNEKEFKKEIRRRSIRSFAVFILAILACFGIYRWITKGPKDDRAYAPFRKVMDVNSKVFATKYDDAALTKEFPKSVARTKARFNGDIGLKISDTTDWILKVARYSDLTPQPSDTIYITLADLKAMPYTEVVFNFKCIEGWSQISWWRGVRFSDFASKYNLGTIDNSKPDTKNHPEKMAKYCGLRTPDGEYYVGIDMPSMMHPQTILCYNFRDQPLTKEEGAPLRLIIPVKYGIKHLKRIGTIFFSNDPPPDYWAKRGYDYYAGL
jgi:DMSO/TMAO reductase YedYZ molybdopterin-dependent catalytic subunit